MIKRIRSSKVSFSQDLPIVDQIKENFLLITAHQLKTPLNVIRLNLQMILSGDLGVVNQQVRRSLMDVFQINRKIMELTTDFLNASEIEMGKTKRRLKPVNIIKIITEVAKELRLLADKKLVKLELSLKGGGSAIESLINIHHFRDVIYNLVSNAIKYNRPRGKVKISLIKKKKKILLIVSDSGIGIPRKDQKNLFSQFFRSANAIKQETEGSGLGLFIVKSYVASWGGRVWFKSKLGQGSTFYIEIPTIK